jgi:hypothetical protein
MLKLDNTLLDELGLGGLPEDQKRAMLQHIYETLELRVGTNLANQMTDQQLEEFEKFIDDGGDANQAQALQWLETNLPNYKQVVNEVFEALKVEVGAMAPQLMSASPNQAGGPMAAGSAPMSQMPQGVPASDPYAAQPTGPVPMSQPLSPSDPLAGMAPAPVSGSYAAQPMSGTPQSDQSGSSAQPGQGDYSFPAQQPPAGPGGYPPQR